MANGEENRNLAEVIELHPRRIGWGRWILGGVALVLGVSIVSSIRQTEMVDLTLAPRTTEDEILMDPAAPIPQSGWLLNPELTTFERWFCRGNRNAASCERRPLHPFAEYYVDWFGRPLYFHSKERSPGGDTYELGVKPLSKHFSPE